MISVVKNARGREESDSAGKDIYDSLQLFWKSKQIKSALKVNLSNSHLSTSFRRKFHHVFWSVCDYRNVFDLIFVSVVQQVWHLKGWQLPAIWGKNKYDEIETDISFALHCKTLTNSWKIVWVIIMFTNDRAADVFIFGKERGQLWRILHAIKHFVGCFTITIVLKWWDGQTNGHKYALNEQHEKETGLTWLFLNTGMSLDHPGVRPQFLKAQWKIKNMQLFKCSLLYHSGSSACFLTHAGLHLYLSFHF